jgi:hypothetical protein
MMKISRGSATFWAKIRHLSSLLLKITINWFNENNIEFQNRMLIAEFSPWTGTTANHC